MYFFFKQKTAYEMRISDWSSDVCSSDLGYGWQYRIGAMRFIRESGPATVPIRTGDPRASEDNESVACPPDPHVPQRHRLARRHANAAPRRPARHRDRSEARRVGTACASTFRYSWAPYHTKKTQTN